MNGDNDGSGRVGGDGEDGEDGEDVDEENYGWNSALCTFASHPRPRRRKTTEEFKLVRYAEEKSIQR